MKETFGFRIAPNFIKRWLIKRRIIKLLRDYR